MINKNTTWTIRKIFFNIFLRPKFEHKKYFRKKISRNIFYCILEAWNRLEINVKGSSSHTNFCVFFSDFSNYWAAVKKIKTIFPPLKHLDFQYILKLTATVLCIYFSVYYTFVYIAVSPNKFLILEYTYEVSFLKLSNRLHK